MLVKVFAVGAIVVAATTSCQGGRLSSPPTAQVSAEPTSTQLRIDDILHRKFQVSAVAPGILQSGVKDGVTTQKLLLEGPNLPEAECLIKLRGEYQVIQVSCGGENLPETHVAQREELAEMLKKRYDLNVVSLGELPYEPWSSARNIVGTQNGNAVECDIGIPDKISEARVLCKPAEDFSPPQKS